MGHQRLTTSEVEAATRHLPGGAARARLLEEKDRNQVFAVGEQAIFKVYLSDGCGKQARKIAALAFLAGRDLPVPRLLGHGILPRDPAGVLRPRLLHGEYGASNAAAGAAAGGHLEVSAVFDFESAVPGDPVEDFLWNADHGLDSPIFRSFVAGYLEYGQLDPGAPERFAFYQLEHCLAILGWAHQTDPEYFAQALWLIEQALAGARLPLP